MKLANGVVSTTSKVWDILLASYEGDLARVREHVADCPELAYAQYNYAPPINFAVREGHIDLVRYLLELGAHDPEYRFYPFQESLQTVAADRGFDEIVEMLNEYQAVPGRRKFRGDNGEILYKRSEIELEFQQAADVSDRKKVGEILEEHPEFARDETFFWAEGILVFAAKENDREMINLLMSYGAKVPKVLKWTQFYYFERLDGATYMMEKGMDPNTMSWQHVTILHDMAQKGHMDKARLLIKYGAEIDPIDEAYQSTPLGLAARWGNIEMVDLLLAEGADPNRSGASWSTPISWARTKGNREVERALSKAGAVS
ncbi:MAG: ankyrin repeat domain-containing protein [Pyrinomonadaceae bacterium]